MAVAAAKAVAAGAVAAGRDEALRCPERPGAVPGIGHRNGSQRGITARRPSVIPASDWTARWGSSR